MRRGAHTPIFDPEVSYGAVSVGATIGAAPTMSGSGASTQADQTTNGTGTVTNPASLSDYTIQLSGGYAFDNYSMNVTSGDFLLIANTYRSGGASATPAPAVSTPPGPALSGVTSIAASANYDTLGTSRGSARMDRATAASTGTMLSNQDTDTGQCIMRWANLSGAPVQQARSTGDANDSCNISLPSAPSGTVIVVIMYGGGNVANGQNQQTAAPAGWTKVVDHHRATSKGILVLKANTPQQTFTYSLVSGSTTAGGRDVHILEW